MSDQVTEIQIHTFAVRETTDSTRLRAMTLGMPAFGWEVYDEITNKVIATCAQYEHAVHMAEWLNEQPSRS